MPHATRRHRGTRRPPHNRPKPAQGAVDRSIEARIGKEITPEPCGCWSYKGDLTKYHQVSTPNGGAEPAHRWVYELLVGPVLEGHEVHHTCENPGCVNPAHLRPLSRSDHRIEHARRRRSA